MKYKFLDHTDSSPAPREERQQQRAILLPVLMVLVVFGAFYLVISTRPEARPPMESDASDFEPVELALETDAQTGIVRPPKIELEGLDFDMDLRNHAHIPSSVDIDQLSQTTNEPIPKAIPVARVISNAAPAPAKTKPQYSLPILKPNIDASRFTPWMTPAEMNQHIQELNRGHTETFWNRGHWIVAVEGRWGGGREEYRIVYEADPRYAWRYRISQSESQFSENIESLKQQGFQLVQSQVFKNPQGESRYQAIWQYRR